MTLLDTAAAAGRAAKANGYVCGCGHDVLDHAWARRRCKELDSYGVRCTCPFPERRDDDDDDDELS